MSSQGFVFSWEKHYFFESNKNKIHFYSQLYFNLYCFIYHLYIVFISILILSQKNKNSISVYTSFISPTRLTREVPSFSGIRLIQIIRNEIHIHIVLGSIYIYLSHIPSFADEICHSLLLLFTEKILFVCQTKTEAESELYNLCY